ncbi:MAG: FAD-dependent oxidoreductase [Ruminiclostridium sp.]|nr:FAD-dependent oxidoreductase [Ruminiclostridium sp.]
MKKGNFTRNVVIVVLFFLTFWFGIRPIITGEEFERKTRKAVGPAGKNQYALVVFGTEPEGVAAALSASRMGLKTLLVTEDLDPGGIIKSALVTYTSPDYAIINGEKKRLTNGIYTEFFGETGSNFSIEDYISTTKKKLQREPNLKVIYDAGILSVQMNDNLLEGVNIYGDGETQYVEASVFIDATEDGTLLSLCNVPCFQGSGDINVPDSYMPVEYNFIISDVNWQDIESIRKGRQIMDDFQSVLKQYQKNSPKIRISNLKFIGQPGDDIVISGIRMHGANVNDPEKMEEDFNAALKEAQMLTVFLQVVFVPFENCTFRTGPSQFYIPENRHYEGRYRLKVEDILENRDFPDKVVMASAPVDAEKFVSAQMSEEYSYIMGNPTVYSIPLGCFISKNLDNLLMVGKKASFSSLASTSAGRMSVNITAGEAMGVTAAWCYLNDMTPAELMKAPEQDMKEYQGLLKRAGLILEDFDIPNPNADHWAWNSIKVLTEYGLVAGGMNNDYLLNVESNEEHLTTLLINLMVKAAPQKYSLEFDSRLSAFRNENILTGEKAAEILLKAADIPYTQGNAFQTAKDKGLFPAEVLTRISPDKPVTLDCVYAITVYLIDKL